MLIFEKESLKQEDNSTSSNSENDFKELDIEIDKVIRGETSFEEEKHNENSDDQSPVHKKETKKTRRKNHNNNFKENIKELNKKNILKQKNQTQYEKAFFEKNKKNLILNLINSDRTLLNNINYANNINNCLNINNNININNYNSYFTNIDQNNGKYNIHMNNGNNINFLNNNKNNYLNELILYLYNKKINDCINNNKLNNFNISCNNNMKSNSCTYSNVNTSMNVNNISLLNVVNNQLNDLELKKMQENNMSSNIMSNLNISNNNYINKYTINNNSINSINNINEKLLPIQIRMQLINNNMIEFNQNLLLLNSIKNNNNLNLMNNQTQNNFNYNNINNLNKVDEEIQSNTLYGLQSNLINLNQDKEKLIYTNNASTYKRKNSQKPDVDVNKNIINLMDIFLCRDLRTTLMIKNIPNKYTISSFLDEINTYFKFTYDIFYLPIDYVNRCNLGFAFINFVEPFHIILFYELYRGKKWKKFNSDKICELLYAKFQGKKELISHFEKGKVLSFESEEKRPLILTTPDPLPKINLPLCFFDLFIKIYPHISYEIKEFENVKKNNNGKSNHHTQVIPIFSINGNFRKN